MSDSRPVILAKIISRLLGWTYFLCWSGSFYPQPISNYKRKSTLGLAIDFPTLNILGFICYTISTTAFFCSATIKEQYAFRHPESPENTVRFNDLMFAAHGSVMCLVVYSQFFPSIWGFNVGARQKASKAILGIFWGGVAAIIVTVYIVLAFGRDGGFDPETWAWLDVIYAFGYVKLLTVVVKYMPQAYLNFQLKSTAGWSIYAILLDFAGGITSLVQLMIDSLLQGSWDGVLGNPVKFGLGNISIAFDIIFIYQHYFLYRKAAEDSDEEEWETERQELLAQPIS